VSEVVLDASALLALLREEPGQHVVRKNLAKSSRPDQFTLY